MPIAQLDRASGCGPEGCGFNSLWARIMIYKLQAILGLFVILGLSFLLSENKKKIKQRIIFYGLFLQIFFIIIILKTKVGFLIFNFANKIVYKIIEFSDKGASFVFGKLVNDPSIGAFVAFKVLPIIIFVSAFMAILYYFGIIQFFVKIMAKIMQKSMKISGAESLGAALLIFMGIESSTAIKEYIKKMTKSEIFTYMTAFMSTIASSVMASYVSFGVSAGHLLAASIMSAPAAVMIAKIIIPETEEPETMGYVKFKIEKSESNLIEAIANGASVGVQLAIQIGAMLIAFVGLIYMLDGILKLFNFSLDKLFGYIFYPFAFIMGVPSSECFTVAKLLGTKTVFNEFIAYLQLKPLIEKSALSYRSIVISTYALCGFSNFGSIGILIGGLSAIAPDKKSLVARIGIKSLIAGTFASFLTAIIAGFLV